MDESHCICCLQQAKAQTRDFREAVEASRTQVISAREGLAKSKRTVAELLSHQEQMYAAERAAAYNKVSIIADMVLQEPICVAVSSMLCSNEMHSLQLTLLTESDEALLSWTMQKAFDELMQAASASKAKVSPKSARRPGQSHATEVRPEDFEATPACGNDANDDDTCGDPRLQVMIQHQC